MKHQRNIAVGCLLGLLGGKGLARAENLWEKRHPDHAYLFFDSKARNVGDLITVVISQSTDVGSREDRGMKKATSIKGLFNLDTETDGGFGAQGASAKFDLGSTSGRQFDGGSSFRSEQALTDRMTATVMDVLPNGNMVIAGKRRVRIAGEERTLVLTGVVRAIDLGPDNTIPSRFISDLDMFYESGGTSQTFTRQGWLGRATNKLWPF